MKTLLINNFSPYINNIIEIFNDIGNDFECYDCNQIYSLDNHLDLLQRFDNVVLSGRQQNSSIINKINSRIVKGCLILDKPLLGICYGGQILALTLGSTLKKMEKVRDFVNIDIVEHSMLLPGYESVQMFESHNFCVSVLSSNFQLLGSSDSCKNELFCFNKKPLFGTQFHPEKSGKHGKFLFDNFLRIN